MGINSTLLLVKIDLSLQLIKHMISKRGFYYEET
jgi:hypothetical protein